jgi:hypothetical protein
MDVMGGVLLDDSTELKVVTGVDDHSRFCIAAGLVTKATSKQPRRSTEVTKPRLWPLEDARRREPRPAGVRKPPRGGR